MSDDIKKPSGLRNLTTTSTANASVATGAGALRGLFGAGSLSSARTSGLAAPSKAATSLAMRDAAGVQGAASGRLIFVIDATGSRAEAWDVAQKTTANMFDDISKLNLGKLAIRVLVFRGSSDPQDVVADTPWHTDAKKLQAGMKEIGCMGGSTQFVGSFKRILTEKAQDSDTIIMIGDSFEEEVKDVLKQADKFKAQKSRVFAFHEGYDPHAESVFKDIAERTGGAFAKFDANSNLSALMKAAAAFAAGGEKGLSRLASAGSKEAGLLQSQLRLSGPGGRK